jgi:arsenite oxidase large subunit
MSPAFLEKLIPCTDGLSRKLKNGDLVEVFNDDGSTQTMIYPTPTAKRKDLHAVRLRPISKIGRIGVAKSVRSVQLSSYAARRV